MFRLVSRAVQLPPHERQLLARAVAYMWRARVELWRSSFADVYRRHMERVSQHPIEATIIKTVYTPQEVARAVARGARVVPRATCLVKALAGHQLLREAGHEAVVRIGVNRSVSEEFGAHAWVECGGQIVIGGKESAEFSAFPRLPLSPTRMGEAA